MSWSMPLLTINVLVVVVVVVLVSDGGIRVKVIVVASAVAYVTMVLMVEREKKRGREIVPWCLFPPSAFAVDTLALPVPDRMEKFERQVRKTTLNFS